MLNKFYKVLRRHDYYATREFSIQLEPPKKEFDWDSDDELNQSQENDDGKQPENYGCEIGPFCILIFVGSVIIRAYFLVFPIF